MSDVAIKVQGLGKKYIIGHQRSGDLRESFGKKLKNLLSKNRTDEEEFWALKDVSFEIKQGEAVGIIGRNGAGKSTLLKLLSRITDPSAGRFEINGRVSSLLEVGTGFHPELTGRENIFLNGTILGMRRAEIKSKFNEIVEFSGITKFIDTPVKHYSSGMKVRLAFSVAAHLEPEILIVDEVLAVGDAEFQRKCLGKMDEVSKQQGRTVLFVSHNMTAVEGLCQRGLLLNTGNMVLSGKMEAVIKSYIDTTSENGTSLLNRSAEDSGPILFTEGDFVVSDDVAQFESGVAQVPFNASLKINLKLHAKTDYKDKLYIAITIVDQNGTKVSTLDNLLADKPFYFSSSDLSVSCEIKKLSLNPGIYYCSLWCSDGFETLQQIERALKFEVVPRNYLGTGKSHSVGKHGFIYFDQEWTSSHN